jgi:hypothetical protein
MIYIESKNFLEIKIATFNVASAKQRKAASEEERRRTGQ